MKQLSEIMPKISESISPTATAEPKHVSTGALVGSDGFASKLPIPREQLTAMRPMEIDKAMADWLPRPVVSAMRSVIHLGPDPGRIGETIDWRLEGEVSEGDARSALETLKAIMAPADPHEVTVELTKMRAVMASRKDDSENQALILAVFVEQIEAEGYPIDVIREARRDLVNVTTFWPTWSEFKARCDREFLKRRAFYIAMRRLLARMPQ